jgi:hypothetical protein
MSIPTPGDRAVHPVWCNRQHAEDYPVHTAEVGEQDIELGETELSVSLYQYGGDPMQVWLCEHRRDDTAVTVLTGEQAAELGRRLLGAAGMHGRYVTPLGEGNSGPGAPPAGVR